MEHNVRVSLCACLLVASGILFGNACSTSAQVPARSPGPSAKLSPFGTKSRVVESFVQPPLSFEANQGQTDPGVRFLARGQGYTLFLTRRAEAILSLAKQPTTKSDAPQREAEVIRMSLASAAINAAAAGVNALPGKANYFIGNDPKNWRTNVPVFAKAKYRGVYPGVDLVYYGNQGQLEYDFIVAPGTDPRSVALNFTGVKKLSIDVQGALVLQMKEGDLRLAKPLIYQEINGERREISGGYALKNAHEVSFQIPTYDPTKSLVIDPTLSYSTYLGGTGFDSANSLAVDATGNAYVTGWTSSVDFPVTPGAFQTAAPPSAGGQYAFVTKLNAAGSGLVYSTYLGGNQGDVGYGIRVDSAGNAYVTGNTSSTNFPVTPGAFQEVKRAPGASNVFVTKLNADGSALVYSTYLGGSSRDIGQAIALDTAGNAYVAGWTFSTDFPTTLGAFQPINRASVNATTNAFLTELNAQGAALLYSTYLGGSGGPGNGPEGDTASSIAADAQGNAYVTGRTCSADFPTTPLAFQMFFQGSRSSATSVCSGNAFMSKLNPALVGPASLVYSTYLGGSGGVAYGIAPEGDAAYGIAVDTQQNAYVTGQTCSSNFPVTPLAFQVVYGGVCDAFVTKLNPSGPSLAGLVYSTFLGGSTVERGAGIDVDSAGNAYIAGYTLSTNFPTTPDAFQTTIAGNASLNAFVTVLNPSGSAPLVYSTYLGGSTPNFFSDSNGRSIAVDMAGQAYVTGYSYAADFPTTPGAFQTAPPNVSSNVYHSFVAKFSGFPTQ